VIRAVKLGRTDAVAKAKLAVICPRGEVFDSPRLEHTLIHVPTSRRPQIMETRH
jgi:hypothetical protein